MISVIISLYNKEKQIYRTIKSVLSQTCQDFEIIVVDDGSTDAGAEKVKCINDKRIRLISQQNAGVSAARNKGIEEARGEYIAFLDADDEWKEDYLATQIELVEKYPQCDVFATNYEFRDSRGIITPTIIKKIPFQEKEGILINYFEVASHSHPPLWTSAVMVRKQAIQSIGGFPKGIRSGEDLLTWAKLAVKHKIAYSRKVCAVYNVPETRSFGKPMRIPQQPDIVGKELATLYKGNKHIKRMKAYVGLWHKMRSSIYLRIGNSRECRYEAFKALHFHPSNYKLYVYLLLSFIPNRWIK